MKLLDVNVENHMIFTPLDLVSSPLLFFVMFHFLSYKLSYPDLKKLSMYN